MDLEQLARETALKTVGDRDLMNLEVATATILSALNKAVKETRADLLELLASTDETVALHDKFTGKYRGI